MLQNWARLRMFPSGSLNQAIFAVLPGGVQMPFWS
jgi:hypothetical protein